MKVKTNKCKSCGKIYEPSLSNLDKHFCSGACKYEAALNGFNELDKEFNTTKEVVLSLILIVFLFMTGLYMYAGLN